MMRPLPTSLTSIFSGRSLADALRRDQNNFDLLRLVAAVAVIFGHAYTIAPEPPKQDPILLLLRFDFSGSLAVKFFFFLSGLLTTDSLLRDRSVLRFAVRRGFRIVPGLLVCVLLTAFMVGPLLTALPLTTYLSELANWPRSIGDAARFVLGTRLPGVLAGESVNGSLWTLPLEVLCYIGLGLIGPCGLLSSRWIATLAFCGVIAVDVVAPALLPGFNRQQAAHLLPACFAVGALFALYKRTLSVAPVIAVTLWVLPWLATGLAGAGGIPLVTAVAIYQMCFYVALFYSLLYLATLPAVVTWLKLPFDASYGVYIYGYLVQQCLRYAWPGLGLHGHQALASLLALGVGALSWFLVEKPAIRVGARLASLTSASGTPGSSDLVRSPV